MNEKLSMLHIPEVLRHYTECQDLSLGETERMDNIYKTFLQNIFVRVSILVDHPHTLQTFGMQTRQR